MKYSGFSAPQEPFNLQKAEMSLRKTGKYKCSANLWWQNFHDTSVYPLNQTQINTLKNHYFDKPNTFPMDIVVVVPALPAPGGRGFDTWKGAHLAMWKLVWKSSLSTVLKMERRERSRAF